MVVTFFCDGCDTPIPRGSQVHTTEHSLNVFPSGTKDASLCSVPPNDHCAARGTERLKLSMAFVNPGSETSETSNQLETVLGVLRTK